MKYIRDPIYEYIEITDEEARLIDTPLLQRLRHISQNGPARLVYPSLLGTRFEHTLGVAHVASQMLDSLLDESHYENPSVIQEFLDSAMLDLDQCLGVSWHSAPDQAPTMEETKSFLRKIIRHAGFFHDVGHICLSHTLERALQVILNRMHAQSLWMAPDTLKTHELLGVELVRSIQNLPVDLLVKRGALLILLATGNAAVSARWRRTDDEDMNLTKSAFGTLRSILVGDFDADRTDYLERDGNLSASGFGAFDITRFIKSLRLIKRTAQPEGVPKFQALPTVKALSALESTLIERYKLYKWVYYHHKVALFSELAYRAGLELLQDHCQQAFFETDIQGETIELLRGRTPEALTNPVRELPPFLVLPTENRNGYRKMNNNFFFPHDNFFCDDSWFSTRLRATERASPLLSLSRKALVLRGQVSLAMWKEYNGFRSFTAEIPGNHARGWLISQEWLEAAKIQAFIREPWQKFKTAGVDIIPWQEGFSERFENALSQIEPIGNGHLIPIVYCNDWNMIGSLKKLEIIQRDGTIKALMDSSPILERLSGTPDNVPYFLFLLGEEREVSELKAQLDGDERAGFCNTVRSILWQTFKEIAEDPNGKISGPMIRSLTT